MERRRNPRWKPDANANIAVCLRGHQHDVAGSSDRLRLGFHKVIAGKSGFSKLVIDALEKQRAPTLLLRFGAKLHFRTMPLKGRLGGALRRAERRSNPSDQNKRRSAAGK